MYLDTISKLNFKKDHENNFLEYIKNLAILIDEYKYGQYTSNMKYFINNEISIIREASSQSKKLNLQDWIQKIRYFRETYPLQRKFVKTLPKRESLDLKLETVEEYRKKRRHELIMFLRSAPEADRFKTELEKLFNNQIERIKIIKEQEFF